MPDDGARLRLPGDRTVAGDGERRDHDFDGASIAGNQLMPRAGPLQDTVQFVPAVQTAPAVNALHQVADDGKRGGGHQIGKKRDFEGIEVLRFIDDHVAHINALQRQKARGEIGDGRDILCFQQLLRVHARKRALGSGPDGRIARVRERVLPEGAIQRQRLRGGQRREGGLDERFHLIVNLLYALVPALIQPRKTRLLLRRVGNLLAQQRGAAVAFVAEPVLQAAGGRTDAVFQLLFKLRNAPRHREGRFVHKQEVIQLFLAIQLHRAERDAVLGREVRFIAPEEFRQHALQPQGALEAGDGGKRFALLGGQAEHGFRAVGKIQLPERFA